MGVVTELLFLLVLGFLLFGPKKVPAIFRETARAKAQIRHVTHAFTSHWDMALEPESHRPETNL